MAGLGVRFAGRDDAVVTADTQTLADRIVHWRAYPL